MSPLETISKPAHRIYELFVKLADGNGMVKENQRT
jgi:hypothetical protein